MRTAALRARTPRNPHCRRVHSLTAPSTFSAFFLPPRPALRLYLRDGWFPSPSMRGPLAPYHHLAFTCPAFLPPLPTLSSRRRALDKQPHQFVFAAVTMALRFVSCQQRSHPLPIHKHFPLHFVCCCFGWMGRANAAGGHQYCGWR